MPSFLLLLVLGAAAGTALADLPPALALAPQRLAPATPPALYSFADLHRLALAGAAPAPSAGAGQSTPDAPLRLAGAQPRPLVEPSFAIRPARPQPWLLLLSGLALAGWVAHRRLAQAL